jgi:hypothetical protein
MSTPAAQWTNVMMPMLKVAQAGQPVQMALVVQMALEVKPHLTQKVPRPRERKQQQCRAQAQLRRDKPSLQALPPQIHADQGSKK